VIASESGLFVLYWILYIVATS